MNKEDEEIPPFLVAGSPSALAYKDGEGDSLNINVHRAAAQNDLKQLRLASIFEPDTLDEEDDNGWQVRSGAG